MVLEGATASKICEKFPPGNTTDAHGLSVLNGPPKLIALRSRAEVIGTL
jgi:hypothetical protein